MASGQLKKKAVMTLNRRLLLGITPVLLILLAVGIYAIVLFQHLGGAIDVILRENYNSVVASQNMQLATERMNAGMLLTLSGEEQQGKALFAQYNPIFETNSDVEAHNITLPGEGDLEHTVQQLHAKYSAAAAQFFALPAGNPARRTLYDAQLLPASTAITTTAEKILEINRDNMVAAKNAARKQGREASRYMIIALAAGFAVAAGVAWLLARSIVRPVQSLTESAQELGEGNLDQHVPVQSSDEVGQLAAAFNKMAARLRAYRQSTTEKILQAQQTTESALRAFPDPIVVYSPELNVQLMNAAAERFLKLLGADLLTLGSLAETVENSLNGSVDFHPTSFDKAILVNLENSEKFYLPRVLAMRQEGGMPVGVVVALQDVTRFRVADDVKTDLIATVNPKQTELLLAARNNSDRLFEMIEDLLDLARFEGGAALIEKKPVAAQRLVEEIAAKEREQVAARGLKLDVEIEPLLPRVEISRMRIEQVFANFLSNAVKYSPQGGTITLRARREGANQVRFSVHDEGPGVPKEARRKIFEKFYRVAESRGEGAGLGLSIAREVVLAHAGSIGVDCEEGKGSEFFFVLPALV